VAEVVRLQWTMLDLKTALFHVRRVKNGLATVHPLRGTELRALRQLHQASAERAYVFVSERGSPLTPRTVHHIVAEAGRAAGFAFPVHPHMLRHACGFYLANKGVDTRALQQYLGHRNIQHTVRYTALTPQRFQHFWED
jgi:site-specific recombinase XerD